MMVLTSPNRNISCHLLPLMTLLVILALGLPATASADKGKQKSFASPEKASQRLFAAVKANNVNKMVTILGPGSEPLVSSGDGVADASGRKEFINLYEQENRIEHPSPEKSILIIGPQNHPFPIPLIKKGSRWRFDTMAGREEILNRRIGKNELNAIAVARAYVLAQREYSSKDRDSDGRMAFAQRFRSSAGMRDGLYWEVKEGEEESPFGPLTARAADEGYGETSPESPDPYQGYLFKIIKAQGENAVGGAYDYVVNCKMVLGFALVAYPAQHGSSGIMTFIVNQSGVVYQKDLGEASVRIASAMTRYDPDKSWIKVE
jgi:Protein of unknown function (DUF2950)